jgi:hypothetical protein
VSRLPGLKIGYVDSMKITEYSKGVVDSFNIVTIAAADLLLNKRSVRKECCISFQCIMVLNVSMI